MPTSLPRPFRPLSVAAAHDHADVAALLPGIAAPVPDAQAPVAIDRRHALARLGQGMAVLTAVPATALGLASCASARQVSAEVASFGEWPAGRTPGTYALDVLPSQQAQAGEQSALEAALRPALARAGFQPVPAGQEPDVLVQAGVRINRTDRSPWDDPLWWHGGFGSFRYRPWRGPYWGVSMRWDTSPPRYEREVALLLRDRASGKPLYEARASSEGYGSTAQPLMAPLFSAALSDFPVARQAPHTVVVPVAAADPAR